MAEGTTIQRIIEIHAERSTDTVKDLKQEINDLKDALLNVEKGTKDYDAGVKLLQSDQKRLNEVTALSKKENMALAGSYYDLNAQLVEARKEWKGLTAEQRDNADVGGALQAKIQSLDSQLKAMDASIGQYQRNVGDYRGALTEFGETLKMLPAGAGKTVKSLKRMGSAMKLVSTNPLMGIIGMLAPLLMGISKALKENEGAMAAIHKAMEALKPVGDVINGLFEKLGDIIGNVVEWFGSLFKSQSETFKNIAANAIGVGNVLKEALLTPVRAVIEAVKGLGKIIGDIIHGDFDQIKDDAKAAGGAIKEAFKKGVDVKANFQVGKEAGEEFVAGLAVSKPAVKKDAEDKKKTWMSELEYRKYILQQQLALEQENSDEWVAIQQDLRETEFEIEKKRLEETIQNEEERRQAILLAEQVKNQDLINIAQDAYVARLEAEDAYQQEMMKRREEQRKAEEKLAKEQEEQRKKEHDEWVKVQKGKVAVVQNSLSTVLSLYEAFGDENAKQSEGYKAIASAQAMIQAMLSANEAYASMASIPYVGPVLGAAAAAAALAAGLAQVRQINAVNVKSGASATAPTEPTPAAAVSAPAVIQQVQTTRTVTGAQEEERMNNAQRVYLVYDDVQQAGKRVDVQTAEATF